MQTPVQKPIYDKGRKQWVARQGLSDVNVLASRVHEIALQRWLNQNFVLQAGYPVPVVFATPMDAYAEFSRLWQNATDVNNPFNYLVNLRDSAGNLVYQPYPSNICYPLVSVKRTGWSYRPTMSWATTDFRLQGWATVEDVAQGLTKEDLAWAQSSRMPQAWNYRFQIDHFAMRPDTQARFVHQLMKGMYHSGAQPQAWIWAVYPNFLGPQRIRMYMDAEPGDATEDPGPDAPMVYHTTFSAVIEGYFVDLDTVYTPTLWSLVLEQDPNLSPGQIASLYSLWSSGTLAFDLRVAGTNPVVDALANLPPWAPIPTVDSPGGTTPTPQGLILNGILP